MLIVHQCFLMTLSRKIIVFKPTLQTTNMFFFSKSALFIPPRAPNSIHFHLFLHDLTILPKKNSGHGLIPSPRIKILLSSRCTSGSRTCLRRQVLRLCAVFYWVGLSAVLLPGALHLGSDM